MLINSLKKTFSHQSILLANCITNEIANEIMGIKLLKEASSPLCVQLTNRISNEPAWQERQKLRKNI